MESESQWIVGLKALTTVILFVAIVAMLIFAFIEEDVIVEPYHCPDEMWERLNGIEEDLEDLLTYQMMISIQEHKEIAREFE